MATITAHDGGRADAALVQRFRQSQTPRERTAVFADVVRQHRHAVLSSCAERLWPDADAAVAVAAGVLAAARLAMADPAKLPRPDRLGGWLLAIAAQARPAPGQPARIDDVDWEAVRARIAVGAPEMRESPARLASLRQWLERIVATLPEPRQRMYDLFVTRGLDSRNAALELGTTADGVRRLRRENRDAILRAFEVTALAAEAAVDPPGPWAPGCGELRQTLADARGDDGDPHGDGRRPSVVLSAALRLTLSRHLGECRPCQDRRDDCMARWAPELLPILADAELHEQVMGDVQSMSEPRQSGAAPGAHRRVAPARPVTRVVIGRAAVAAAGAGVLAALLLIAFVWPGVLRGTRAATDAFSPDRNKAVTSGADAPTVTSTVNGVPDGKHRRPARPGGGGLLSTLPPTATDSPAASSPVSVQPSVYYTVPPATAPTSSPTQPPAAPSPSPPASQSRTTSPTPSASTSGPTPTPTPTPSASTSTPTPTPSASTSTPTPTTSASTPTPTPSASASATSEPTPTASASASSPTSAPPTASSSTAAPSTAAPSASATT